MMAVFRLVAFALAVVWCAPAVTAEPIKLAQSEKKDDYLPPWESEEATEPSDEGDIGSRDRAAPRSLSPPSDSPERRSEPRSTRRYEEPARRYEDRPGRRDHYDEDEDFTPEEILDAGHRFFGTVTKGLADVVEYAFSRQGYPNGYILGEEAGGAFVAGLRYGEGMLYTKHIGRHKVFWQGPSIGYDFGAEGSKTMILVYDIQHPAELYHRFAGVDGSAYLVGGVGLTFQKNGPVVLAPIRSGVGLRLGANVGYLKYTRRPTWNPF